MARSLHRPREDLGTSRDQRQRAKDCPQQISVCKLNSEPSIPGFLVLFEPYGCPEVSALRLREM